MSLTNIKATYIDPITNKVKIGLNTGGIGVNTLSEKESILERILVKLLTYRGSNAFQPNSGSKFFRLIGGNFSKKDTQTLKTTITLAFEEIVNQIIAEQEQIYSLTSDLLVAGVEIISIIYDDATKGWSIKVKILFADGNNRTLIV